MEFNKRERARRNIWLEENNLTGTGRLLFWKPAHQKYEYWGMVYYDVREQMIRDLQHIDTLQFSLQLLSFQIMLS